MLQYSNIDGAATPSVQAIALPPGRKVRFAVSVLTFHDLDGPQKRRVLAWMLGQLAGPALAAPQLPFTHARATVLYTPFHRPASHTGRLLHAQSTYHCGAYASASSERPTPCHKRTECSSSMTGSSSPARCSSGCSRPSGGEPLPPCLPLRGAVGYYLMLVHVVHCQAGRCSFSLWPENANCRELGGVLSQTEVPPNTSPSSSSSSSSTSSSPPPPFRCPVP